MKTRRKPYTEEELRKQKCVRCGKRARFQWNACADNNTWRPVCSGCDVELNKLTLSFLFPTAWVDRLVRYCYRIGFKWKPAQEDLNSQDDKE